MTMNPMARWTDRGDTAGADPVCAPSGAPRREASGRTPAGNAGLFLFALMLLIPGASREIFCQEVVVFTDHRSLVVSSHREAGPWIYLKVDSGEMAVQSSQVAEIRNEGPQAYVAARAVPPPIPVAPDEDVTPTPAPPPPLAEAELPEANPPPSKPPRGPMDAANRPAGLRARPVAQMGMIGAPGPNSVKR